MKAKLSVYLSLVLACFISVGCDKDVEIAGDDPFRSTPLRVLAKTPTFVAGVDAPLLLDRVAGAVFLGDRIAIGNAGFYTVTIVSAAGRLLRNVGRDGLGPGEYQDLQGIARFGSGLVVWDSALLRATILDEHGDLVRVVQTPLFGPAYPQLIGAFGDRLLFLGAELDLNPGVDGPIEFRRDVPAWIVDTNTGAFVSELSRPGQEVWAGREGTRRGYTPVIFGTMPVAAVTPSDAWIADTGDSTLTRVSRDGTEEEVSLSYLPRRPTTIEWTEVVRDTLLAALSSRASQFMQDLVGSAPARPTLPAFSALRGGSQGGLWLREHPNPLQDSVFWIQLDSAMQPVQRVAIPIDKVVLDWSPDRVILSSRGPFDEHLVEVYTIRD